MTNIFHPGDSVKFLDQQGEAIILSVEKGMATIKTSDDFEYQHPISKLVLIKTKRNDSQTPSSEKPKNKLNLGNLGIYLAFEKNYSALVDVYLLNKTEFDLLISCSEKKEQNYNGRFAGLVASGTAVSMFKRNIDQVTKWRELQLDVMYFKADAPFPKGQTFFFKPKATDFLNPASTDAYLKKPAHVFQLDELVVQKKTIELKEKLKKRLEPKQTVKSMSELKYTEGKTNKALTSKDVYDLHSEAIPNLPSNLDVKEILLFQLRYAEKLIDEALVLGKDKITLIHGIGDGILKREIQKMAKEHPHIKSFGKAEANKYGGGATFLKLG